MKTIHVLVTCVLRDRPNLGLMPGYCVLGIRKLNWGPGDHSVDHTLKTWPEFFDLVAMEIKTFEVRKDDRTPRYEAGQVLKLVEFDPL